MGTKGWYALSSLTQGLPYRFKVSTVTEVGEGPLSTIATFYAGVTPTAPNNPTRVSSTSGTVTIDWTGSTATHGGLAVSGWRIYGSAYGNDFGSAAHLAQTVAGTTQGTVSCTSVYSKVRARGSATSEQTFVDNSTENVTGSTWTETVSYGTGTGWLNIRIGPVSDRFQTSVFIVGSAQPMPQCE